MQKLSCKKGPPQHVHGHYKSFTMTYPQFEPIYGPPIILKDRSPVRSIISDAIRSSQSKGTGNSNYGGMPSSVMQLQSLELAISNRGGDISFGGNMTVASMMGKIPLGATTMGFNYKTGESGRSMEMYSQHVPLSMEESIRVGAATGIDTTKMATPALAMHLLASNSILQLTQNEGKMNASAVFRNIRTIINIGAPSTTSGRITATEALIKGFKEAHGLDEEGKDAEEESSSSKGAKTGGPMGEDPEGPEKKDRKTNCGKSESPVRKELKPHQGKLKTDGEKIYDWDHTHNDIEMYNSRGEHIGTIDPVTGTKIKDAVAGRKINV